MSPLIVECYSYPMRQAKLSGETTQNGVPLNVIQEMGAWESAEMVRRYAHLAPEQFAQHARVIDDLLNGTNLAQSK
ncbi:MAG: hypothetical protein Q8M57_10440 [Nitrosomonas sp.]|nr:hypothetical protein [Nitrosomonas sp.]MDP3281445.1 hypothetical protein [Nitrosomonas sp.]